MQIKQCESIFCRHWGAFRNCGKWFSGVVLNLIELLHMSLVWFAVWAKVCWFLAPIFW